MNEMLQFMNIRGLDDTMRFTGQEHYQSTRMDNLESKLHFRKHSAYDILAG